MSFCDFIKMVFGRERNMEINLSVKVIPVTTIEERRTQTYLQRRPDLSVVRSITANELIIAVLESSVLNDTGVVEL
jgi:hypothetical protein